MDNLLSFIPLRSTRRAIKKRSIMLYQGEVPRQAYIVKTGVVKVYRLSRSGDEQIVSFRMPGDIFPESWVFNKTSSALYYYEAVEDSEIITVEKQVFLDHVARDPKLERLLLDYFITSHTGLIVQVTALEQSRAADKLLLMLYYLSFRYGKQTHEGEFTLKFHLTHTTLANLTGLTRETTTVELGKLRRRGVVSYTSSSFIIYRDVLNQFLAKESFNDVQLT